MCTTKNFDVVDINFVENGLEDFMNWILAIYASGF